MSRVEIVLHLDNAATVTTHIEDESIARMLKGATVKRIEIRVETRPPNPPMLTIFDERFR